MSNSTNSSAAQGLLEQGDGEGAKRYLEELSQSPSLQGSRRLCDNDIANAVLSSKLPVMERERICTDFEISLPQKLAISDIDLCALLGNALDNAIEAAGKAADKYIMLRVSTGKGILMLRVENALEGEHHWDNGSFQTTKQDKRPTASVLRVCVKLRGVMADIWKSKSRRGVLIWSCTCILKNKDTESPGSSFIVLWCLIVS